MLCSECYKNIPRGVEIQISGTIFCKECTESNLAKKGVIAKCNACFEVIFNIKKLLG